MFGRAFKGNPNKASRMAKRARQLVSSNIAFSRRDDNTIEAVLVCVGSLSENPLNGAQNKRWRTTKLRESQRVATMFTLARIDPTDVQRALGGQVNCVHLVRLSPGMLDDDAVPAALKSFRDQLVAWMAHDNTPNGKGDDGPKCGIRFTYAQAKQHAYGVRMELRRET